MEGQENIKINSAGELVISTILGDVVHGEIYTYEVSENEKKVIPCRFARRPSGLVYFEFEKVKRNSRIIIDPIVYSTFLGGNLVDEGDAVFIDSNENAYVVGSTQSTNFPATTGAYNYTFQGSPYDAYVTKIDPSGTKLVYSTFLGGDDLDYGLGIDVDDSGYVYIAGRTISTDFPVTASVFQDSNRGNDDGFITKLSPDFSSLIFSTLIGGKYRDRANYIMVDESGCVYVTGWAESGNFPVTSKAYDQTHNGDYDGWFAKFNRTGSQLIYSTFFGGSALEEPLNMIINDSDEVTIVGYTYSSNFPTSPGAFQTTYGGGTNDGFIIKFNADASALKFSSFIGKAGNEMCFDISQFSSSTNKSIIVCGTTGSSNFPTGAGCYQNTLKGSSDAFIINLSEDGKTLIQSTYLGGTLADEGRSVCIDSTGFIYLAGFTSSTNFPVTSCAPQLSYGGGSSDIYIAKIDQALTSMQSCSYFGGNDTEHLLRDIFVNKAGMVWFTGRTWSKNYPTLNACQPAFNGGTNDGILTKYNIENFVIITSNIAPPSLCTGVEQGIGFSINCRFNSGNLFTAQLSDSNGSFDNPLNIGQLKSTTSGSILVQIPDSLPDSDGYRIRVNGSNPSVIGSDNSVDLSIHHGPSVGFSINDSCQCIKGNLFNFTNLSSVPMGSFTSLWNFGDGDTSSKTNGSHSYSDTGVFNVNLIIISSDGCRDSLEKAVLIKPKPIADFNVNDSIQCFSSHSFIFTSTSMPIFPPLSHLWDFSDGDTSLSQDPVHLYTACGDFKVRLMVTSDSACADTAEKTIRVIPNPPKPLIRFDAHICEGDTTALWTDSIAFAAYLWTLPGGKEDSNRIIIINNIGSLHCGMYSLKVLKNGCESPQSDTLIGITAKPPIPKIYSNQPVCEGDTLKLWASSAIDTLFWAKPDKTIENASSLIIFPATLSDSGLYLLTRIGSGCLSLPDSDLVSVIKYPASPAIRDTFMRCEGDSVRLYSSFIPNSEYLWSGPDSFESTLQNPEIYDLSKKNEGNYILRVKTVKCMSKEVQSHLIVSLKPEPYLGNDTAFCPEIQMLSLFPGNFREYLWQDLSSNKTFLVKEPGVYYVTVKDVNNCINSDTVFIEEDCDPIINIPNTFTPNGDGLNDTFRIFLSYVDSFTFDIFNRWGEHIFFTKDASFFWDGTFRGVDCPIGDYYWHLIIYRKHRFNKRYFGTVTLLR